MAYEINLPSLSALLNFDDNVKEATAAAAHGLHDYLSAYIANLDNDRANPLGGTRSHFYRHAAEGITEELHEDSADVVINQTGFRQRLLGGEIHAKNSKYLTIPAIAEAYGHHAPEFDLVFVPFKSGAKALAGPGKDNRPHARRALSRVQHANEIGHELARQRVVLRGIVQRQYDHRPTLFG